MSGGKKHASSLLNGKSQLKYYSEIDTYFIQECLYNDYVVYLKTH